MLLLLRPEQTYAKLKQSLKNEDIDMEEKREEWRENLEKIKEKGFMHEMEQDLTELKLELEGEAIATYTFDNIDSVGFSVSWSGTDGSASTTSGLAYFDIQYKIDSDGQWQDWIMAATLKIGLKMRMKMLMR